MSAVVLEREREEVKEKDGAGEQKHSLCHFAPASARVTHLLAHSLPSCSDTAGEVCSSSDWRGGRGHSVQQQLVKENS